MAPITQRELVRTLAVAWAVFFGTFIVMLVMLGVDLRLRNRDILGETEHLHRSAGTMLTTADALRRGLADFKTELQTELQRLRVAIRAIQVDVDRLVDVQPPLRP